MANSKAIQFLFCGDNIPEGSPETIPDFEIELKKKHLHFNKKYLWNYSLLSIFSLRMGNGCGHVISAFSNIPKLQ